MKYKNRTPNPLTRCCDHGYPCNIVTERVGRFLVEPGLLISVGNHSCRPSRQFTGFDTILQCEDIKYHFLLFCGAWDQTQNLTYPGQVFFHWLHPQPEGSVYS